MRWVEDENEEDGFKKSSVRLGNGPTTLKWALRVLKRLEDALSAQGRSPKLRSRRVGRRAPAQARHCHSAGAAKFAAAKPSNTTSLVVWRQGRRQASRLAGGALRGRESEALVAASVGVEMAGVGEPGVLGR